MGSISDFHTNVSSVKRNYYIYRYQDVRTGDIIYVGKTKRNLKDRILEHESELKFIPYLAYVSISYYVLGSHAAMDVHEKYWIHHWQPALNVVDRLADHEVAGMGFTLSDVGWKPFDESFADTVPAIPSASGCDLKDPLYESLAFDEAKLENLDAFLELVFESYLSGDFDDASSHVVISWDMDCHPIPDWISVFDENMGRRNIGIYISAKKVSFLDAYDVRVSVSSLRDLLHVWPDYLSKMRVDLARRRLELDERFGDAG